MHSSWIFFLLAVLTNATPIHLNGTDENIERRLLNLEAGSDLVRNYVKMGAYFGALYVFLERNSIMGKNKIITETLDFDRTSILTNPCQVLTMSVDPEIQLEIESLASVCHSLTAVLPQPSIEAESVSTMLVSMAVPAVVPTAFQPTALPSISSKTIQTVYVTVS